jgi:hypothetical protein
MVRQLGLQSGVAMEVAGRCAETFPLRSDALCVLARLARGRPPNRNDPFVAVAHDVADVLPCTAYTLVCQAPCLSCATYPEARQQLVGRRLHRPRPTHRQEASEDRDGQDPAEARQLEAKLIREAGTGQHRAAGNKVDTATRTTAGADPEARPWARPS